LETVDGGPLEDVTITNIAMRDIVNAPIYLRLGARMRGPQGVPAGKLRRVLISNVIIHNAAEQAVVIAGIPDNPIEEVRLENIHIGFAGGGTEKMASTQPSDQVKGYPEPANLGPTPSYGFFVRYVNNLELSNVRLSYAKDDVRPPFVIENVKGAEFVNVKAQRGSQAPVFLLRNVDTFTTNRVEGIADMHGAHFEFERF
jgi:hypothetical protein